MIHFVRDSYHKFRIRLLFLFCFCVSVSSRIASELTAIVGRTPVSTLAICFVQVLVSMQYEYCFLIICGLHLLWIESHTEPLRKNKNSSFIAIVYYKFNIFLYTCEKNIFDYASVSQISNSYSYFSFHFSYVYVYYFLSTFYTMVFYIIVLAL